MNPSWRQRVARLVLVAGAAGLLVWTLDQAPQEQTLELPLSQPEQVVAVELSWLDHTDEAPLGGVRYSYPRGTAPDLVRHRLQLPDGQYQVVARVERADGVAATTQVRRVTLRGEPARLTSREPP